MPTLNLNDMIGGVNVFGPNGLNTNLQQHQAAETQPERPATEVHDAWAGHDTGFRQLGIETTGATAATLVGHHHGTISPMQDSISALEARIGESVSALESRIGELDAANDDIYQKLDTLQEQNERRLSMDTQEQVQVQEQVQEEKDVVISIMKTKKTTEVVVANAILESISNLVKKG